MRALRQLADRCDVLTYEFRKMSTLTALTLLSKMVSPQELRISKTIFSQTGILKVTVAPYKVEL